MMLVMNHDEWIMMGVWLLWMNDVCWGGYFLFNLFLTQWVIAMSPKGCKSDNFESHTALENLALQIFEVFGQILLNVNLSLN